MAQNICFSKQVVLINRSHMPLVLLKKKQAKRKHAKLTTRFKCTYIYETTPKKVGLSLELKQPAWLVLG